MIFVPKKQIIEKKKINRVEFSLQTAKDRNRYYRGHFPRIKELCRDEDIDGRWS